jgi:Zn finger protein HypA/HybF involved in hydrogenase expression
MRFYFAHLVPGTPAEGAALIVESRSAQATCRRCGLQQPVAPPLDAHCPRCGAADIEVEGGHELLVDRIEIETE